MVRGWRHREITCWGNYLPTYLGVGAKSSGVMSTGWCFRAHETRERQLKLRTKYRDHRRSEGWGWCYKWTRREANSKDVFCGWDLGEGCCGGSEGNCKCDPGQVVQDQQAGVLSKNAVLAEVWKWRVTWPERATNPQKLHWWSSWFTWEWNRKVLRGQKRCMPLTCSPQTSNQWARMNENTFHLEV